MPNQQYNPIQSVGGVAIPCPSKYEWTINDVSDADAGRTEDGKMHKMRVVRKRKLELEWKNVSTEEAQAVRTAFAPEYVSVSCLDALAGGYATRTFYKRLS